MVRKGEWPQIIEHSASRSFLKGSRVIVWDGKRWISGEVVERNLRGRRWDPYLLVRTDEQIKESFFCGFSVVCDNASHTALRYEYECAPKQGDDIAEFDDMSDPEPNSLMQAHQESYPSGFELFCSASSSAIRYEYENPGPDDIYTKTYLREMTLQERRYRRSPPNMYLDNAVN